MIMPVTFIIMWYQNYIYYATSFPTYLLFQWLRIVKIISSNNYLSMLLAQLKG